LAQSAWKIVFPILGQLYSFHFRILKIKDCIVFFLHITLHKQKWRAKNGARKTVREAHHQKNDAQKTAAQMGTPKIRDRKMARQKWRTKNDARKTARQKWRTKSRGRLLYISFFVEYDLFKEVRPLINTFKNDPHFLLLNKTSD